MSDPVRLRLGDHGIADLSWQPGLEADRLQQAVTALAEEALESGLRRIEVAVPASDRWARRAVLRSGFRVEGVRRSVVPLSDGTYEDLVLFARLAADVVGGPHGFSGVMNTVLPRKRLIAHVLMRDAEGRILLCDTAFKSDWELPGGIVEPGEAPRDGAIREVREELGIDLPVGRLLVADWLPPYLGWDDALELIFDGGLVTEDDLASFSLQENEITSVSLLTLDQAAEVVTPLSHRRLSVAVGQSDGATAYLQDGRRVGQDQYR
ncbi:MAG TPA: NUDIX hydrolase [Microlunatus sp.]|nr:NUDIX hydrolase [Microlunatus sp.]